MDEGYILHADIACSCNILHHTSPILSLSVCRRGMLSGPGTVVSPIVCVCVCVCVSRVVCSVCCHPLVGSAKMNR